MKKLPTDFPAQGIPSPAKCAALNKRMFRGLAHEKFALACSLFILAGLGVGSAPAAVSLTGFSYTQDFSGLGATGTTFGTTGWEGSGALAADNGGSNSGGLKNYGASSAADRALGSLGSGSAAPRYGVVFTNSTGLDINTVTVSFTNEQWRSGSNAVVETNAFSYKAGVAAISDANFATGATPVTALDVTEIQTANNTNTALDGNAAANRSTKTASITGLTTGTGATLGLSWKDIDATGSDAGMAVDDFSLVVTAASINNSRTISSLVGTGSLTVQNSVATANTLTVDVGSGTNNNFAGVLQNGAGTFALTKTNTGTLTLAGTAANTYSGTTTVNGGMLVLNKTAGVNAIAGNVSIGDGSGVDILRLDASNQIADTSILRLAGSGANAGTFRVNGQTETVGGLVSTSNAGVVENGATAVATLTVNTTADANFSGVIQNGSTGALAFNKAGTAVQTLSGAAANTYTGTTSVNGGILALSKTAGVNAIAGNVTIGDGTGNDILRLDASNQVADTSRLAFNGSGANAGILRLNGQDETIGDLVSNSAGAGIIENNHASAASTLTIDKTSGTSTFSGLIRDGAGASLSITKQGNGGLILSNANTYSGTTTVSAGTLIVSNNAALGTSDVVVSSNAELRIDAGVVLSNVGRTFSLATTAASYTKAFSNGESFANANALTSNLSGGEATKAEILGGSASSAGLSLEAAFKVATVDTLSDIVALSGLDGEVIALQLTVDPGVFGDDSAALGWFDSIDSEWKLAVEGNHTTGIAMQSSFENWDGDFESFRVDVITAGTGNIADYVGAYGVDAATGEVWAIVDHNSDFAAITTVPEPGTVGLLAVTGMLFMTFRRRRTRA